MDTNQTKDKRSPAKKLLDEMEQFILDQKYYSLRAQPLISESLWILRMRVKDELKKEKAIKRLQIRQKSSQYSFINETERLQEEMGRNNRWG